MQMRNDRTNQKNGRFELRLGKLGITIFILGVSSLIFAAFQFGIVVGKDIDAYPDKIAGGLPGFIKQKITKDESGGDRRAVKKGAPPQGADKENADQLTFYNTLSGKKEATDLPKISEEKPAVVESGPALTESKAPLSTAPAKTESVPLEKKVAPAATLPKEYFFLQVISLKEEKKAEEVRKKLGDMGFPSELDTREVKGEKFYRVKMVGFKNREDAVRTASAVQKKAKMKCMLVKAKAE